MTHIDTGVTGAKRVSFRKSNPRELLLETIKSHKKLYDNEDDYRLLKIFTDEVMGSEAIHAVVEYYFTNHIRAIRGREASPNVRANAKRELEKATKDAAQKIEAVVTARVEVVLLNMMLPNGKALRDCTGAECAQLGTTVGKWLTKIAGQIGPAQTVGNALSEAQVRKLYGR